MGVWARAPALRPLQTPSLLLIFPKLNDPFISSSEAARAPGRLLGPVVSIACEVHSSSSNLQILYHNRVRWATSCRRRRCVRCPSAGVEARPRPQFPNVRKERREKRRRERRRRWKCMRGRRMGVREGRDTLEWWCCELIQGGRISTAKGGGERDEVRLSSSDV